MILLKSGKKKTEVFTNNEIETAVIINRKHNINVYMKYMQYRF